MKVKISIFAVLLLSILSLPVFAATWDSNNWDNEINVNDLGIDNMPADDTTSTNSNNWANTKNKPSTETNLNAAGKDVVVIAPKWWIGNYQEVPCNDAIFTSNSCNQCFDWGKKWVGEKITWLTDTWTNPNSSEQIIYKEEQIMPDLINIGWAGTVWLSNPKDPASFWKFDDEIVWTNSATNKWLQEYLLEWNKTVWFLEADLGASYALQSTDKSEWSPIGLLKFSINYRDTDNTWKESEKKLHTECVAYYASAPAPKPVTVKETPKEVTKVKTGPESYVLVLATLIISLIFIRFAKKPN